MTSEQIKELLARNAWFSSLSEKGIAELVSMCKIKVLSKGQRLHAKGDQADGFYRVLQGKIRVSNVNSHGKEMVLTWLSTGSWFGEISLFDNLPRTHDAHAESDSQLLMIPIQHFQSLLKREPSLYPHFMALLCQRIRATFSLIDETSGLSLQGQLAKRLLLLSNGLEQSGEQFEQSTIEVSQESLAHMLNSSRQTINGLLGELKKQGVIDLRYGKIIIKQPDVLSQLSQI